VDHALFLTGHRNLLTTGWAQIALAGLVAYAIHRVADPVLLTVWLACLILTGISYTLLHRYFAPEVQKPAPNVAGVRRWQRYRRTLQFCSAVGWGSMAWLMVPGATVQNAILMTVFTGVVGHAAAGNSANDYLGVVISAITTVIIFTWHIPAIFGDDAVLLMLMLVLYVVALISSLGNTHRSLRQSIRLQHQNQALAISNAAEAARAEKANRDKSEFLAAASHDLRQPVHALLLLVEAYRQQVPQAHDHRLMTQIVQAGQSINGLFNALMELSRLESGSEKVQWAEMNIKQAMQSSLKAASPQASSKRLSLRSFVSCRLPSVWVWSDEVLFGRVLSNLVTNAVRYTHSGGVLLALRPAPEGGLWLEVWDSGIGISQADQDRIFDPYVQVNNKERDRSKGLGLGLAIVKHAAELLGMTVSVRSQPGHGTRFRISIPADRVSNRKAVDATDQALPQTEGAKVVHPTWLMGARVLLVEDDPLVLAAMLALLQGWGMDLRTATRGDASVLQVCGPDWAPDCVLCDYRLPGPLTGIDVLDEVQRRYPQAIGIMLTGEMLPNVQREAEDAGYLLLSKPVDAAVLAATLGTLLDRRHEERA